MSRKKYDPGELDCTEEGCNFTARNANGLRGHLLFRHGVRANPQTTEAQPQHERLVSINALETILDERLGVLADQIAELRDSSGGAVTMDHDAKLAMMRDWAMGLEPESYFALGRGLMDGWREKGLDIRNPYFYFGGDLGFVDTVPVEDSGDSDQDADDDGEEEAEDQATCRVNLPGGESELHLVYDTDEGLDNPLRVKHDLILGSKFVDMNEYALADPDGDISADYEVSAEEIS